MILINFLFPNRNRFLIGKGGELPTNLNNYESVNTIKFIGLQHSFLTDVIDQINNCYSLQVRKRSMNFQNSILGFQQQFCFVCFQIVVNTAGSFIFSVLSLYTYFQYFIQKDEYFWVLSWKHVQWQILFLTTTLMAIHKASLVSEEVSSLIIIFFYFTKMSKSEFINFHRRKKLVTFRTTL